LVGLDGIQKRFSTYELAQRFTPQIAVS
jgi:hypothetical protein